MVDIEEERNEETRTNEKRATKIPFLKYVVLNPLTLIHLIGQGAFASNARLIFLSLLRVFNN